MPITPNYGDGACATTADPANIEPAAPSPCSNKKSRISAAQTGRGCFPPIDKTYGQNALDDSQMSGKAFAVLIDEDGYTLHQLKALWNEGEISDEGVYIVASHGLTAPEEAVVGTMVVSDAIKNPKITAIADPAGTALSDDDQVTSFTQCPTTFKVRVPDGFDPVLQLGEFCLVDGQTIPAELAAGTASFKLTVANHTISSVRSDGSKDHEFTFAIAATTTGAALAEVAANKLQAYAFAYLKRQ